MSRTDDAIRVLLQTHDVLTTGLVARKASVSRQVAQRRLSAMVNAGLVVMEGAGRATQYRRAGSSTPTTNTGFNHAREAAEISHRSGVHPQRTRLTPEPMGVETASDALVLVRAIEGLREDKLWQDLARDASALSGLAENVSDIIHYAVTELVNNAIDHAEASQVRVTVGRRGTILVIAVEDDGIGIFDHVRSALGLASELEAIQDLSKGKLTTMPERHTGEGLFFSSKAVDRFEISSGTLTWAVDNLVDDTAIVQQAERIGTRAVLELDEASARDIRDIFDAYTEDFEFTRTRAVVRLFAIGVRFVSRSEAKRLVHNLERFREIILDFAGVQGVGQGFADEVFRVWANAHPEVTLRPMNMNEPVAFMLKRAMQ